MGLGVYAWSMGLALRIPLMVIMVAALVLAIMRWHRHPLVSLYALIGAGLALAQSGLAIVVPAVMRLSGPALPMSAQFQYAIILSSAILSPVSWAFMVAAVFCRREMTVPEALARHFEQEAKAAAARQTPDGEGAPK